MGRSYVIAIVGGSGAGKTWLANRLQQALPGQTARLSLDDFYRDRSHLTPARRERINFDHPRAIDWPWVERVLRDCAEGRPTHLPKYNFATHCRHPEPIRWDPKPIVLMEGLWLLRPLMLRPLFHWRIFIDCPAETRLFRRIHRDAGERGRTKAVVRRQFFGQVLPMHERYVAPQARWADEIICQPCGWKQVEQIASRLQALLRREK